MRAYFILFILVGLLGGCISTSQKVIETDKVASYQTPYNGVKTTLIIGSFDNRSNFMEGVLASDKNHIVNGAKTKLKVHLQQTNRFKIVDREHLDTIKKEAEIGNKVQNIKGARYSVIGSINEFGRKETGDSQLFGILGSGKTQIAYAKISLYIIDVLSSEIIYSSQGAGEHRLSEREVLGFGATSTHDNTLSDKALNLAIMEAVQTIVKDIDNGYLNVDL